MKPTQTPGGLGPNQLAYIAAKGWLAGPRVQERVVPRERAAEDVERKLEELRR